MADIQSNIKVNIDTSDAMASIKLLQKQISAFQTQMAAGSAANARAAQNLQRTLIDNINASGKFSATMTNVRSTTESFTHALEANKLTMREYFRYAGGASKSFGKLFKSEFDTINKVARERVKSLQTQYVQLGRDANGAMKAIKVRPLMLDMESLGTKTAIAAQRQQLLNQLLKQGSTAMLNWGKNTQWAGRQLMVGFSVPIGILGTTAAKTFMQMEEQAIKFKRVYGDTFTSSAETDKMIKQVRELANEFTRYGIAAKDTMEMAATAAAAGKTGADLLSQVSQASRLAVLGNVDQQKSLETTISLTNAFGVTAKDLGEKINFLNAVENQTLTSIDDLTTAIPKAAPVIKQLGGNVEDLSFFLTAMKEGGINASEGANALKSGLASLINPTDKASKFLGGLGINLKSMVELNKGNVKGLVIDFAKALDQLDPLKRAQAIEQLFGKFQFARLSTLFQNVIKQGSQASRVLELTKKSSVELAALSAKELRTMAESPMYKFQKAVEDFKVQLAPVGEEFLKAITPLINFGTDILKQFNNMSDGAKQFVVNLTGILGVAGPVILMTFGLIANGVANLIKGFSIIKGAFNNVGKSSLDLAAQTQYMTSEQIDAAAIAASLDQAHSKLRQTFTLEAGAVNELTAAYARNIEASRAFGPMPNVGGVRKFVNGGLIYGPGTGTSDSIPAMVSTGEFITSAQRTKKYLPLLQAISQDKVPGFASPNGGSLIGKYGKGFKNATIYLPETMNTLMGSHSGQGARLEDVLQYSRQAGAAQMSPLLAVMARQMGLDLNSPANRQEWQNLAQILSDRTISALGSSTKEFIKDADIEELLVPAFRDAAKGIKVAGQDVADAMNSALDEIHTVGQVGSQSGAKGGAGRTPISPISYKRQGKKAQQFASDLNPIMYSVDQVPSKSKGTKKLFRTINPITGTKEMATMSHIAASVTTTVDRLVAQTSTYVTGAAEKIAKAVTGGVTKGFDSATKRNSPPKEAISAGEDYGNALNSGAESKVDDAKVAGQKLAESVTSGVSQSGIALGGTSGKARRAQAGQGAPQFEPQVSRIGRRVQRAGESTAPTISPIASPYIQDGQIDPAYKNQAKERSRRQRLADLRKLKTTSAINRIGTGKIAMGGFGASMGLGLAGGMIGGDVGNALGTASMGLSMLSMFPSLLSKFAIGLSGALPYVAAAAVVIGGLVWAFTEIDKAAKERIANEKALNNSIRMSAEGIKGAAEFFGIEAKQRIGSNATVVSSNLSGQNISVAQQLLNNSDFAKQNAKQIDALKRLNTADAQRALAGMAADFSSLGFGEEAVQAMVDAMILAAKRKDVSLDFKSINVITKTGSVGQQKEIQKILDQQLAKVNINDITQETRKGAFGSAYTVYLARNKEEMQALYDAGKLVANQLASLQSAFNNGAISVETYSNQFEKLSTYLKQIPNDANRFSTIQAAIKSLSPEMAKFTIKIKDSTTQVKLLQAALLGLALPESLLKSIAAGSDAIERKYGINATDTLDKLIAKGIDAQKLLNEALGGGTGTPEDKKLTGWQDAIDKLKLGLEIISLLEKEVNKKYDTRLKKLEEIKKLNQDITAEQKDQMDIAEALSKGDVSGAARAAQQMRANNAQRALESQTKALELSRDTELARLADPSGATRAQLESRISKLELLIAQRKFKTAATGGHITGPGSGTSDSIPAMLSNGEYVIRANAVKAIGTDTLDKLNYADKNKFADGGMVDGTGWYSANPNLPKDKNGNEYSVFDNNYNFRTAKAAEIYYTGLIKSRRSGVKFIEEQYQKHLKEHWMLPGESANFRRSNLIENRTYGLLNGLDRDEAKVLANALTRLYGAKGMNSKWNSLGLSDILLSKKPIALDKYEKSYWALHDKFVPKLPANVARFADGGYVDPNNPMSVVGAGLNSVMSGIYENLFGGWFNNLRSGKPTAPTAEDYGTMAMNSFAIPGLGKLGKLGKFGKLFSKTPRQSTLHTPAFKKYQDKAIVKLMRSNPRIAVRMPHSDFIDTIGNGKLAYQNRYELGRAAITDAESAKQASLRLQIEKNIFGIPENAPGTARPVYGAAVDATRPWSIRGKESSDQRLADYFLRGNYTNVMSRSLDRYGDIALLLKRRVNKRSKFTIGDSYSANNFAMNNPSIPARFGTMSQSKILAAQTGNYLPELKFIEAQIFGGLPFKDVKKILVKNPDLIPMLQQELQRAGLKIPVGMPGLNLKGKLLQRFYKNKTYKHNGEDTGLSMFVDSGYPKYANGGMVRGYKDGGSSSLSQEEKAVIERYLTNPLSAYSTYSNKGRIEKIASKFTLSGDQMFRSATFNEARRLSKFAVGQAIPQSLDRNNQIKSFVGPSDLQQIGKLAKGMGGNTGANNDTYPSNTVIQYVALDKNVKGIQSINKVVPGMLDTLFGWTKATPTPYFSDEGFIGAGQFTKILSRSTDKHGFTTYKIGISSTPFQKPNVGRMSPTPLLPGGNSSLPSYGWSGTNQKFGVGKANGGLIKPAYMFNGGSPIDFKPKGMDRIPAMLAKDEYVMQGSAVKKYGTGVMDAINNKTFGLSPNATSTSASTIANYSNTANTSGGMSNTNNVSASESSVYNSTYSINVNVSSTSNANDIAKTVINQIKRIDSQGVKGNYI